MNIIMKLNWLNREWRQKRQTLEIAGKEQAVHWYRGVDVLVKKRVWHRSGPYIERDSSLYLRRSKLIVHLIQSMQWNEPEGECTWWNKKVLYLERRREMEDK